MLQKKQPDETWNQSQNVDKKGKKTDWNPIYWIHDPKIATDWLIDKINGLTNNNKVTVELN